MYAELLSEGRVSDPEKRNHYLQVIVAESQRLTRLVNNVLDFSRLKQGRKKYHFIEFELTGMLRGILETQRLRAKESGVEFKERIPEGKVFVRTDRDGIEQVVLNLIDNAIKYASDGKEIEIDLEVITDEAIVRIMDRGPGVPFAHQTDIFEKFHRVNDSLTSDKPGAGLGLSIAKKILRDLGGDLEYRERDGGGSVFCASLPLCPGSKKGE